LGLEGLDQQRLQPMALMELQVFLALQLPLVVEAVASMTETEIMEVQVVEPVEVMD
jgi:hypothetical protein